MKKLVFKKGGAMEYTPVKITEKMATFAIDVKKCPVCKKDMVTSPYNSDVFPASYMHQFEVQAKRGGFVVKSNRTKNNEYVCQECVELGKIAVRCEICGEIKSAAKIQESIGNPPKYLCKDCYSIIPAKVWNEMVNGLIYEHRYDFI